MKIRLISTEGSTQELFRAVARALPETELTHGSSFGASDAKADLLFWDFDSSVEIPAAFRSTDEGAEHVFLLRADNLLRFHQTIGSGPSRVLLKPFTRAELESFLEQAARRRSRPPAFNDQRRAERDEFLQCLLLAGAKLQQYAAERANMFERAFEDVWAPLTAAEGYCAILRQETIGPLNPEQRNAIERIHNNVRRLRSTADLLRQLGGTQSAQADPPSLVADDILPVIHKAVAAMKPAANARNIEINPELDPPSGPLYFDCQQIEEVLLSYLENALRYTPRASSVLLKGRSVPRPIRKSYLQDANGARLWPAHVPDGTNAYRVDVSDSGPPVQADGTKAVFDQYTFERGAGGRSGIGLSLARCRLVLAFHYGEAFTEPQQKGATFSFVLPYVAPHPPAHGR